MRQISAWGELSSSGGGIMSCSGRSSAEEISASLKIEMLA
jgi:hypothetical protein